MPSTPDDRQVHMRCADADGELKLFQSGEPASVFNYLGIFVQNQCVDALAQNQCVDALATITGAARARS